MPAMRLIWKRVYTAVATARWSILLGVALVHYLTALALISMAGEADLTSQVSTWTYFYMVTATTVGYGDLSPATDTGRLIAAFYVIPGAIAIFTAILGKAITDITTYLKRNYLGMGNYSKKSGHTVIIGWQGDRTRRLIEGLINDDNGVDEPVLVSSQVSENPMPSQLVFIAVETLSDSRGLQRAGVKNAKTIIVRGRNDDETMAAAFAAHAENEGGKVVAHFEEDGPARLVTSHCKDVEAVVSVSTDILVRAACDPGSSQIAHLMFSSATNDTSYSLEITDNVSVRFIDLMMRMKERHSVTVIGTRCPQKGTVDLNCDANKEITSGDTIFYISDKRLSQDDIDWRLINGETV